MLLTWNPFAIHARCFFDADDPGEGGDDPGGNEGDDPGEGGDDPGKDDPDPPKDDKDTGDDKPDPDPEKDRKKMERVKKEAEKKAVREFMQKHGLKGEKQLADLLKKQKERDDAQKSELQKETEKRKELEAQNKELQKEILKTKERELIADTGADSKLVPNDVRDVIPAFRRHCKGLVEDGDLEQGKLPNKKQTKSFLTDLKKRKPYLFAPEKKGKQTGPERKVKTNTGGGDKTKTKVDNMSASEWAKYMRKYGQ